jgi:endonuclease YncB( thermonuclease family)
MKAFFLLLTLLIPCWGYADNIEGKVIRILDGDTIDVINAAEYASASNKPVRVRLSNIDAPEKKQAYGSWSAKQLKALLTSDRVHIEYRETDRYGRILGTVYVNGINLNREMVRVGAAWVYERYNTDHDLPDIQTQARKSGRGLWGDANPIEPWIWRQKLKAKEYVNINHP